MGHGGARKGWRGSHRRCAQGTRGAAEERNPTSGKVTHDGLGPSCSGGTSLRLLGCWLSRASLPRGSLPPAERFLGFFTPSGSEEAILQMGGQKGGILEVREGPLAGAGALKGHSLLSCHLGDRGLGGHQQSWSQENSSRSGHMAVGKEPHPSAPGSGRGVMGATGVLPTTFPCPHRFFGRESPKRLITSRQLPLPGLWSAWPGRLLVLHGHTPLRAGMAHGIGHSVVLWLWHPRWAFC